VIGVTRNVLVCEVGGGGDRGGGGGGGDDDGGVGGDDGGGGGDDGGGGGGGDDGGGEGDDGVGGNGRGGGGRDGRDRELWDQKHGWNNALLPNVPTTKFEALLMVLHLFMRHGMTGPFIAERLKFINVLLGEEVIPTSIHFQKIISSQSSLAVPLLLR